jgi:hypothetical protein
VATTDIGNAAAALEFLHDALQRREPVLGEVGRITRAKELLRSAEKTFMMLAPRHALAGAESFTECRLVVIE